MSRTTITGSPTTVPMTMLSPAGIAVVQCTSEAGKVDGGVLGEPDAGAEPRAAAEGLGLRDADDGPLRQAPSKSIDTRANARAPTPQHYARGARGSGCSTTFLRLSGV